MRVARGFCVVACLVVALLAASPVAAQPPDQLSHYHVVPGRSVFVQSGGFAGMTQRYPLRGEYDFLQEWNGGTPTTDLQLSARFDNADLRAPLGEMLPAFIDVDDLLNIENLRGELLPLGAPFDVFRFTGIINDSDAASPLEQSSIELYAAKFGPWMYLYGETTPPPHTADRFEYQIKALARTRPWADKNADGVVDIADYTMLRDGGFDREAYLDWRDQFGESEPDMELMQASLMASLTVNVAAAPEPASLALILAAGPLALLRRRVR